VATIDAAICTGCGSCVDECPNGAIFMESKGTASSFHGNASSKPFVQSVKPLPAYRNFSQQSGLQPVERSGGILEQVFDFFGRATNSGRGQGCGQGRGCSIGKGRGKNRRR